MALVQKNGEQLNTAVLDLSRSFDANSLCNTEEIIHSFCVRCKGGTVMCNRALTATLNASEA